MILSAGASIPVDDGTSLLGNFLGEIDFAFLVT
jgi:hypothetical protein